MSAAGYVPARLRVSVQSGGRGRAGSWISGIACLLMGCVTPPEAPLETPASSQELGDPRCALPGPPETVRRDGAAVLVRWRFPAQEVYAQHVVPPHAAFLAFRSRVRADGADVRRPVSDRPEPGTSEEAEIWRDEDFNNERAQSGEVGVIAPITCLDALLFAHQHARVSQLERPTEFLASVLSREGSAGEELVVVFGASEDLFPPRSVYGFDVVDEYLADGWQWRYALHNHTLQRNGDRLALGSPVLSTSDVQLTRALAADRGLDAARVTNGFYTFTVRASELDRLRAR